MEEIVEFIDEFGDAMRFVLGLGIDNKELGVGQMALRAVVVYIVTVLMVRLAKTRFMGRATAFDVILGIMLGSVVSRAITGNAPFGPALAAAAVLLAMHWLFSLMALYWRGFGWAVKGRSRVLIRDGAVDQSAMRKAHMTAHDLREDLRSQSVSSPDEVAEGRLERSGSMSIIKKKQEPKVVEVAVGHGVQTVRIELG